MDIFDRKEIHPMLIAEMRDAFDDPEYIFELKLDGERCIAYLDDKTTTLQNKRGLILNSRYPELTQIHRQTTAKCILDGELAILVDGKPEFSEIQRRSLLSNKFKVELASKQYPACFTAFDILYYQDKPTMELPLLERKDILRQTIRETASMAVSRYIEEKGKVLYSFAAEQNLEGVVAKKKSSRYYPGKLTKEWIKFKYLLDDDFIICGYVPKDNNTVSIVLGQYDGARLTYMGTVPVGMARDVYKRIQELPRRKDALLDEKKLDQAVWVEPAFVCVVKYMNKTPSGMLRQAVFKGLRDDKRTDECKIKKQP